MHRFDVHRIFFGQKAELTNYLIRVYGSPRTRAISGTDEERVRAAIVLALSQAFDPLRRDFHRVIVFVPTPHREWFMDQVKAMARELTKRIRAEQAASQEAKEQGNKVLRLLREWIRQLKFPEIGTSWPIIPPDHWVAFGYSEADKIPSWLKTALS